MTEVWTCCLCVAGTQWTSILTRLWSIRMLSGILLSRAKPGVTSRPSLRRGSYLSSPCPSFLIYHLPPAALKLAFTILHRWFEQSPTLTIKSLIPNSVCIIITWWFMPSQPLQLHHGKFSMQKSFTKPSIPQPYMSICLCTSWFVFILNVPESPLLFCFSCDWKLSMLLRHCQIGYCVKSTIHMGRCAWGWWFCVNPVWWIVPCPILQQLQARTPLTSVTFRCWCKWSSGL